MVSVNRNFSKLVILFQILSLFLTNSQFEFQYFAQSRMGLGVGEAGCIGAALNRSTSQKHRCRPQMYRRPSANEQTYGALLLQFSPPSLHPDLIRQGCTVSCGVELGCSF